ncbi:MAG: hypothetical protein M1817_005328 [Caeruleum heppii]|nr:MAG: hypothetical protein M1817_005328 [Caeruleum heppii]
MLSSEMPYGEPSGYCSSTANMQSSPSYTSLLHPYTVAFDPAFDSYHLQRRAHYPLNMTTQPLSNRGISRSAYRPYFSTSSLPSTGSVRPNMNEGRRESSAPVRRRISRACDQCNQLRTKCDGENPCAHCVEFGLCCEYNRERKKRGKASRKDLQQQQQQQQAAAAAASLSSTTGAIVPPLSSAVVELPSFGATGQQSVVGQSPTSVSTCRSMSLGSEALDSGRSTQENPASSVSSLGYQRSLKSSPPLHEPRPLGEYHEPISGSLHGSGVLSGVYAIEASEPQPHLYNGFHQPPIEVPSCYAGDADEGLVSYTDLPLQHSAHGPFMLEDPQLGYTQAQYHPTIDYGLTYPDPRLLEPLAGSQGTLLRSGSARINTEASWPPLPTDSSQSGGLPGQQHAPENGMVLGKLDNVMTYVHVAMILSTGGLTSASLRWWQAACSVARYLHLNSELEDFSKDSQSPLTNPGREWSNVTISPQDYVPYTRHGPCEERDLHGYLKNATIHGDLPHKPRGVELLEHAEERRRVWWLLYAADRHLALSFNQPLSLVDAECQSLRQPCNDNYWQEGPITAMDEKPSTDPSRSICPAGPSFECVEYSVYGCFLPLMTILGQIVDFRFRDSHQSQSHTLLEPPGLGINQKLDCYDRSLQMIEQVVREQNGLNLEQSRGGLLGVCQPVPSSTAVGSPDWVQLLGAYARFVMHALHILLVNKWDPTALLDDADGWSSTPTFTTAAEHVVSAAQCIDVVRQCDPELKSMPSFFGVYILQASFMLLLMAEKPQADTNPAWARAGMTFLKTHEVCRTAPNEERQAHLCQVMTITAAHLQGEPRSDLDHYRRWRKEVLSIYLWTGDGRIGATKAHFS